jgi:hypothetical protein
LLRNIETQRPGGLEVDHKLELDRELNRKLALKAWGFPIPYRGL